MNYRPGEDETLDWFHRGRVMVLQKKKGYRFSVDAPLLADFVRTGPADDCLEIGAGCGIVSLLVGIKAFRTITALEVQESLAETARRNIALNGLEGRIDVRCQDFREHRAEGGYDVVFSNPPYIPWRRGIPSPVGERAAARHELHGDVRDVLLCAARWLRPEGRAFFIFPERRRADFLAAAAAAGLSVAALRDVHHRWGRPSSLFLSEVGRAAAGPARVLAPLVLYNGPGLPSREAEEIFQGRMAA